jgi:hypothetical protein
VRRRRIAEQHVDLMQRERGATGRLMGSDHGFADRLRIGVKGSFGERVSKGVGAGEISRSGGANVRNPVHVEIFR